jgi:hypothetical protein
MIVLLLFVIGSAFAQHTVGAAPRAGAAGDKIELAKKGGSGSESANSKTTSEKALHFARQQRLLAEIDRNRKRDQVILSFLCCF